MKITKNNPINKMAREETVKEKEARLKKEAQKEKEETEKRKKSPYRHFLQVNKDEYKIEDWLIKTSPAAYRILRFLSQHMDGYNAVVCSYSTLCEFLGYSRQTVSNAIKILKDHNYVKVARTGSSNIYFINKNLYWQSYGNNFQYAEFGANVIISMSEQEEEDKEDLIRLDTKKYNTINIKRTNIEPKKKKKSA